VTQNIKKLKRTLFDYRQATSDIETLEAKKAAGKIDERKYDAAIAKGRKHLDEASVAVAGARSALRTDIESSQRTAETLRSEIAAVEQQLASGEPYTDKYEREQVKLRQRLTRAEANEELLKQAAGTESSEELTKIVASMEEEPVRDEDGFPIGRATYTDFPGMTVPERLILLFREIKKNPHTKRPVIISAATIGALILALFGVLIVSGMRNDPGNTPNILGRGDVLAPVLVDGAEDVGRFEVTLTYDAEVLTALSVQPGSLASSGLLERNVSTPGTVTFSIADTTGITGSGELVIIRFRTNHIVVDPAPLTLSSVSVYDVHSLDELALEEEDGWIDTGNLSVMAPVLDLSQ